MYPCDDPGLVSRSSPCGAYCARVLPAPKIQQIIGKCWILKTIWCGVLADVCWLCQNVNEGIRVVRISLFPNTAKTDLSHSGPRERGASHGANWCPNYVHQRWISWISNNVEERGILRKNKNLNFDWNFDFKKSFLECLFLSQVISFPPGVHARLDIHEKREREDWQGTRRPGAETELINTRTDTRDQTSLPLCSPHFSCSCPVSQRAPSSGHNYREHLT